MIRALALSTALALTGCGMGPVALNAISGSDAVTEREDLPYGPEIRHVYDFYEPDAMRADAPLIVFFHGGSWREGSKDIYRFLGTAFGDAGYVVMVPNYRLYPDVTFPAFVEDGALALSHAFETYERPVVVMGHSAGAQIAALLALDPRYLEAQGRDVCEIAAWIGVSGPYDFLPLRSRTLRETFPRTTRPQSQPIAFADGPAAPALLIHGEADVVVHAEDTRLLSEALSREGNDVTARFYEGVGHIDIIAALSRHLREQAPTFTDIAAFIAEQEEAGFPGCP
ncbi:MAG: alpha/beta hydrolase [Rubricella sp.]